jgi:WD40 repeat protein
MSRRVVCGFHPSGAAFAIVSHDQRLKVFNTLTQQLQQDLTERNHLAHAISALAFPAASNSGKASAIPPLIAVGTKSGDVLLWNTKRGEVEQKLGVSSSVGHKHQGSISDVVFHPSGQFLFSVSAEDRQIKQWSLPAGLLVKTFQMGSDQGAVISKLAVSPDGLLLVGGGFGALLLWHISSPVPIREYAGPTAKISTLAFAPDSKHFVSGGGGDRYLTVWNSEVENDSVTTAAGVSEKKKKKQKAAAAAAADRNTPIHTFTLQQPTVTVTFNPVRGKGKDAHEIRLQRQIVQWIFVLDFVSRSSPRNLASFTSPHCPTRQSLASYNGLLPPILLRFLLPPPPLPLLLPLALLPPLPSLPPRLSPNRHGAATRRTSSRTKQRERRPHTTARC